MISTTRRSAALGTSTAHLLGHLPATIVHRPAAVADLGRNRLRLVDRRLRSLELLALVDDASRLGKPCLQRLGMGFRNDRRRGAAGKRAVGRGARNRGTTDQEGQPALHEADATVSLATCLAHAASFPSGSENGEADTDRRRPKGT